MTTRLMLLGRYACSAHGCVAKTEGFYCAAHLELCPECGNETELGTLVDGRCDDCVNAACRRPVDDGVRFIQECICGRHAVRS